MDDQTTDRKGGRGIGTLLIVLLLIVLTSPVWILAIGKLEFALSGTRHTVEVCRQIGIWSLLQSIYEKLGNP